MAKVGIRELKNSLSRYVQRAAAGEQVLITDHGKVVAVMTKPEGLSDHPGMERYNALVAAGAITPARETGVPLLKGIRTLRLPPGTAQQLIDEGRKDFDED